MLIKCPNLECAKRIPSYSTECPYCNTHISENDKVPIEQVKYEYREYQTNTNESAAPESKEIPLGNFSQSSIPSQAWSIRYPELEQITISGVLHGTVGLTPKQIRARSLGPSTFSTCATFKVDPHHGAKVLYPGAYTLKVYKGGLIFPGRCPVTMETPDHVEMFETFVSRRPLGKVTFTGKREVQEAIVTALCCDRFWFAVPFSKNHGRYDKAIGFMVDANRTNGKTKSIIRIKNRLYAQEFAKLNHLENGRWISKKHKLLITMGSLAFVFGLGILVSMLLLSEEGVVESNIIAIFIAILVTLSGLASFLYGTKGEKL
jgi:hypothetical protein